MFFSKMQTEVSNFCWLEAGVACSVWRGELPLRNSLAGGVKDGLQDTTALAGCNMDDSRLEKKHQGHEQQKRQSCFARVLGLIGKGKLFSPFQPESMFHFIKEKQPPVPL